MEPPVPTRIFHSTHISNLPAILESGGLLPCSVLRANRVRYCDVADPGIQDRRATTPVPCGPQGVVHDYVPFYFAPRSPMLFRLYKSPDQCPGGQEALIHLVSHAQAVYEAALPCVFTDGHAVMGLSRFFTDPANLDRVDWGLMDEKYWRDTADDRDRKRRRQAEFLVYRSFPWELVKGIVVATSAAQARVLQTLAHAGRTQQVAVRPGCYY